MIQITLKDGSTKSYESGTTCCHLTVRAAGIPIGIPPPILWLRLLKGFFQRLNLPLVLLLIMDSIMISTLKRHLLLRI